MILHKDKLAHTESKLESEKKRFKEIHQMQLNKHATELLKLKEDLNEQCKSSSFFIILAIRS